MAHKKVLPKVWLEGRQYWMDEMTGKFILISDDTQTMDFNNIDPDTLVYLLMKRLPADI